MAPAMDGGFLASIGVLLLVACLIAMLSRRLGLPYIVGLVVAGFLIALLPNSPDVPLSRELIFNIFLPPLVFEAALQLDWRRFRYELPLTLTLAFFGVGIAATIVACGMHWVIGWSWIGATLFGMLIAATDPVSVIASFREMRCQPRVSMVVESESLLNDGVAAVGFAVLSAIAAGASPTAASVVPAFLWTLGGGVFIGLAVSGAILLIVGRTNDPLVEITLTTIAAYGSFLFAENLHASGIISALAAGLLIGSWGWGGVLSKAGRDRVRWAWEYFAFLANSFVFILIGMSVANQPLQTARIDRRRRGGPLGARRARPVDLSTGGYVQPVTLAASGELPAHFVLGGATRRARIGTRPGRSGERPRTQRDHRHGLHCRRLLDPRPGTDHAVADQALVPRRAGGGGGCRTGGCWLGDRG